ncbi:hypothetical protein JL720_5863 [Aureococcus anophagefferens]|nr:hypothetical protein JL720_5863 [Aureococcus anophagefferens]
MATTAINLQQEGYIPVSIDAAEAAQRLLRECTSNRMVHVTRLLAVGGVDVNARDPEGRTPLHVAAEHGVATVVEALVEAGGDVELRAADGSPPVLGAIHGHSGALSAAHGRRGRRAVASRLRLRREPAREDGTSACFVAAWHGDGRARDAPEFGCGVDAARTGGASPLYIAAQNDHVACVELLLDAGADPRRRAGGAGSTPLIIAAQMGHAVLRRSSASGADADAADDSGWTACLAAAQNGHGDALRALLVAGADPDRARGDGCTPCLIAAQQGHAPLLEQLLKAGADGDRAYPANGAAPAFMAAHNGHARALRILALAKADLNRRNDRGATPAFAAAAYGHAAALGTPRRRRRRRRGRRLGRRTGTWRGRPPAALAADNGHDGVAATLEAAAKDGTASPAHEVTPELENREVGVAPRRRRRGPRPR